MIRKDQQKQQVFHLALLTTAVWLDLIGSPFVQEGPLAPPQPSSAEQNLETSVINASCTGTGQEIVHIPMNWYFYYANGICIT
jgi:hypothetical protein